MYDKEGMELLAKCTLCPRNCRADRINGRPGYCGTGAGLSIASVCIHMGEEPVIGGLKGICNIFFAGCNLHCSFCQNHEISRSFVRLPGTYNQYETLIDKIEGYMEEGAGSVGFVSPSHAVPQMKAIVKGLHQRGLKPVIVYNTNGYDKPETLRSLSDTVDVYLPDFKYVSPVLSKKYSDAADYPVVALRALKEMYWQKGSSLITDDEGKALSGLVIRHLVLPGHTEESIAVLEMIAEELSTGVHISIMSQYHPTGRVKDDINLGRPLYREEYSRVVEAMEKLGFRNGWVQDLGSNINYRPDFSREHPFE